MKDPETPEQWQAAANAAEALLLIESARQYGLINGGPTPDRARCEEILRRAAERGITPQLDVIQRALSERN